MRRSRTAYEILNGEIRDSQLHFLPGDPAGKVSMIEIRGKVSFAYQMGLIDEPQWERLIGKTFLALHGAV